MADKTAGFLDSVYSIDNPGATRALYQDWAATYEQEVRDNGYATPERCARILAGLVSNKTAPLLDLGCGTGLGAEAFRDAGFNTIDGTDFSEEMLRYAHAKPGLYRALILGDVTRPLPGAPGDYANIAAVGVFSPSHAPAAMIDVVIDRLPVGGCFVFSLNDHTLEDPDYERRVDDLAARDIIDVASKEYGPHMPQREIQAMVYVLRKL
jgi:predicted TPR repeat methyltransferase